ncbi:MAG: radical SAM protein [Acidobacteria bacterium]|nr:radical SAM protein [Acidobacteriota bacterium]
MNLPVTLVIPPSVFLLDERVFMNLGILKVASVLEQQGYPVEMLDLSGIQNYEEAARDHALRSSSNCFGLTATTPQLPSAVSVARAIRSVRGDARVILGGPHITLVNAARKREQKLGLTGRAHRAFEKLAANFDVLVAGDGEDAIFQSLARDSAPLIDADDPRSDLFLNNARLSSLPLPARHLVDVDSYRYTIDGVRALSLIAQLGCPFGCGFCGGRESPMLRRVRMRTVDSIIAEMVHLHKTYGVRGFMFYDDELNVNPGMVELMRAIARTARELNTEFRLRGFVKSELFTDEQAEVMYAAGFRWILVGFESGSPRILRNIQKKASLADNTRCMEIAARHNLKVKALMSCGHPGESTETIRETHDWLLEVKPADFDMTIITTYPGTPYYDRAVPLASNPNVWEYTIHGDRLYSYELDYTEVADYYKGDPEAGYKSFVYTDHLKPEEIVELRNFVEMDVRQRLGIPYNPATAAVRYEHSMGQAGYSLPPNILRSTVNTVKPEIETRVASAAAHTNGCGAHSPLVTVNPAAHSAAAVTGAGDAIQVVILCGGKGTRSHPFTENYPKVMMPIGGAPIVVHLMRLYAAQGFTNFVLAVGHRPEILEDYFDGRFPDWSVRIVDTGEEADTGERLRRCAPYVGETFFATYGDGLGDVDLGKLMAFHMRSGGLATITSVPLRSQYGTVHSDGSGQVQRFEEKPLIREYWVNAGFFVFDKRALDHCEGEDLEVDVLPNLAGKGLLFTYRHEGFWKSMDTSKDQHELEQSVKAGTPPWMTAATLQSAAARGV